MLSLSASPTTLYWEFTHVKPLSSQQKLKIKKNSLYLIPLWPQLIGWIKGAQGWAGPICCLLWWIRTKQHSCQWDTGTEAERFCERSGAGVAVRAKRSCNVEDWVNRRIRTSRRKRENDASGRGVVRKSGPELHCFWKYCLPELSS